MNRVPQPTQQYDSESWQIKAFKAALPDAKVIHTRVTQLQKKFSPETSSNTITGYEKASMISALIEKQVPRGTPLTIVTALKPFDDVFLVIGSPKGEDSRESVVIPMSTVQLP